MTSNLEGVTTAASAASERSPDGALLERLAHDDRKAFRELHDAHGRAVYLYASSMLGRGPSAEDAAQETWIALWKARHRLHLATDSLLPWLLVTVRHKALHLLGDKHSRTVGLTTERAPTDDLRHDPSALAERSELRRFLDRLVEEMSETDRTLFIRCIRDGQSYASVSRDLGIGVDAARSRIARIRVRVRRAITTREESP